MSTRLTNALRDDIRARLLARAFDDKYQVMKVEENGLFNEIVDAWLGDHREYFTNLPSDWVQRECCIQLEAWGSSNRLTGFDYRNMPRPIDRGVIERGTIPDVLFERAKDYLKRRDALDDERIEFRAQVDGVLTACTTSKRLYEIWPELAEVYTIDEKAAAGTALLPCVGTLNKTLGLPTEATA